MQPFTKKQLAQAVGLARFLADYDEARIPGDRKIQVRRLVVISPPEGGLA
jgi:hypothetical protein